MKKAGFLAIVLALILVCGSVFASDTDLVVIQSANSAILLSEAQAYFDNLYTQYSTFYTNYGQNIPAEEVQQIRDDTVRELSLLLLLDSKVQEYGLGEITESDMQALQAESSAIYEESVRMEAQERGISEEQVRQEREEYGLTAEFQFNGMMEVLPYTRLYDHVTQGVTVDESTLQQAYNSYVQQDKDLYANDIMQYEFNLNYANVTPLYRPEGYRAVSHILLPIPEALNFEIQNAQSDLMEISDAINALEEEVKSIENGNESTRTAEQVRAEIAQKQQEYEEQERICEAAKQQILPQVQGTIEQINEKLAAGESFASLAAQYNRDENFPTQPDGTCHIHKDSILFDTTFRDAVMTLSNIGDFALTVTDYGVYVFQYVSDVPGGPVEMTGEIADTLRSSLLEDAKNAYYENMVQQWQTEIPIETHPELIVLPDLNALPMEETPDGTIANPAEEDGSIG